MDSPPSVDDLTEGVIGCAIEVHKALGPGLLHSVYLFSLADKLLERQLAVEVEKPIALEHGTLQFKQAFRADLVVDERVIVEVKTAKKITDLDVAQLLTYLKLMDLRVGLILNFNVSLLTHGVRRVVNRYVNREAERIKADG